MDPQLVIFAIEAGVKLGRKVYEVLLDATVEKPLVLPVGDLFDDVQKTDAEEFFEKPENADLVKPGGPYAQLSSQELVVAYKSLRSIQHRLSVPDKHLQDAVEIVRHLNQFELLKQGFGAKPPLQRLLGTVVEIGIDYFAANPQALGRASSARRIVHAFVVTLEGIDLAEGTSTEIVGYILGAALQTLDGNVGLVAHDHRVQVLIGGVAQALIKDVQAATSPGAQVRSAERVQRIASSLWRGGATAFTHNLDLFVAGNGAAKTLVSATLTQVLDGIKEQENLFTNESLELVFKSALEVVGGNPQLFTDNQVLHELISSIVATLTDTQGQKLFAEETVATVLQHSLAVVRNNTSAIINPDDPQGQLLARALGAVVQSFTSTLAGSGKVKDLLSKRQLVDLTEVVFQEVALHPEQLLSNNLDDVQKTPLAQVIGSVVRALGDEPARYVTGESFVEAVRIALRATVLNADKLVALNSADTRTNALFHIFQELVAAIDADTDPRKLVSRTVFLDIVTRILPIVSANLDGLLSTTKPIEQTVRAALALASGALSNRLNGANLPILIEQLLLQVLRQELNLLEQMAVEHAAQAILRTA